MTGYLEFALKHEGVDLCLLREIFRACGPEPIEAAVRDRPTSRYAPLLGFYFEFTTGQALDPDLKISGNYVEALSADGYFVSPIPWRNPMSRLGQSDRPGRTIALWSGEAAPTNTEERA